MAGLGGGPSAATVIGAGGGVGDEGGDDSGAAGGSGNVTEMRGLLRRLMRSVEASGGSHRVQVVPGNAQVFNMTRQTESSVAALAAAGAAGAPAFQAPPLLDGGSSGFGGGGLRSSSGGRNSGLIGVAGLPPEFNAMLPMEFVDIGGGARAVRLVSGGAHPALARRSRAMVHAVGRGLGGGHGASEMGGPGAASLAGASMGSSTGPAHPLFGCGRINTGSSSGSGGRHSAVRLHDGDSDGPSLRRSLRFSSGDDGSSGGGSGNSGVSGDVSAFYGSSSPFEVYARGLRRPGADEASRRRGGVGANSTSGSGNSGSGSHVARWLDSGPAGGRPALQRFAAQVTSQWWREHLNASAATATAAAGTCAEGATTVVAPGEAKTAPEIAESKGDEHAGPAATANETGREERSGEFASTPEAAEAKEEEVTLREDKPEPTSEPLPGSSSSSSSSSNSGSSSSGSVPQVAAPAGSVPESTALPALPAEEPTAATGTNTVGGDTAEEADSDDSDAAAEMARALALSMEGNAVAAASEASSSTPADAPSAHSLAATATAAELAAARSQEPEASRDFLASSLAQASNVNAQARLSTEENTSNGLSVSGAVTSALHGTASGSENAPGASAGQGDAAATATTAAPFECPSDMDPQIFALLPEEVQREIINQNDMDNSIGASSSADAAEADAELEALGLDPEALAALPPSVREEVMAQTRHELRARANSIATGPNDSSATTAGAASQGEDGGSGAADPGSTAGTTDNPSANVDNSDEALNTSGEMDAASIIATLPPDMREDALRQADPSSLPPALAAEARRLQASMPGGGPGDRGSSSTGGGAYEGNGDAGSSADGSGSGDGTRASATAAPSPADEAAAAAAAAQAADADRRRIRRAGQMRLEGERTVGVSPSSPPHGVPPSSSSSSPSTSATTTNANGNGVAGPLDLASLLRLLFLAPPGVTARLLHRPLLNFCSLPAPRRALIACLVAMLQANAAKARQALQLAAPHDATSATQVNNKALLDFPPRRLLGAAYSDAFSGQSQAATGSAAFTAPEDSADDVSEEPSAAAMPSLVAGRLLDALNYLVRHSSRAVYELLVDPPPEDVTIKAITKGGASAADTKVEEEKEISPPAPKRPRLDESQEGATTFGVSQGSNAPLPPLQLPTQATPSTESAESAPPTIRSLPTSFALVEELLSLLARSEYQQSCTQLEQLLMLLEQATLPLAHVCPGGVPPHAALATAAGSTGEGAGAGAAAGGGEATAELTTNAGNADQALPIASTTEATLSAMDEDVPSTQNNVAPVPAGVESTEAPSQERPESAQVAAQETAAAAAGGHPATRETRMLPGSAPLGPEETNEATSTGATVAAGATSATRGSSSSGGVALAEHEARVAAILGRPSSASSAAVAGVAGGGAAPHTLDGGYANPSTVAPTRGSGNSGRLSEAGGAAGEAGGGVGGGPGRVGSQVPAYHLTGTPPVWVAIPGLQGVQHPTALPGLVQVLALDNCTELAFGRCSKVCSQLSKVPWNHNALQRLLAQLASKLSRGALTDLCNLWAELELLALKKRQERQENEAAAAVPASATETAAAAASSSSAYLASSRAVSSLSAAVSTSPTPSVAPAAPAPQPSSSLPPLASLLAGSGSVHELQLLRALRVLCSLQGQAPASASLTTTHPARTAGADGTIAAMETSTVLSSLAAVGAQMTLATPSRPNESIGTATATAATASAIGNVSKLASVELEPLWAALSGCLDVVSDLEGLADGDASEADEAGDAGDAEAGDAGDATGGGSGQRRRAMSATSDGLGASSSSSSSGARGGGGATGMSGGRSIKSSSVASLLVRFLPLIEAFVVVCNENGATTPMPLLAEDASAMEVDASSSSSSSEASAAGGEVVSTPRTASRAAIAAHVRLVSVPGARFRQQAQTGQAGASRSSSSSSAEVAPMSSLSASSTASSSVHVTEAEESPAAKQLVAFAKRHRVPLNALVRQNLSLLVAPHGSLAPLVQVHRARNVLDFDNKRNYFRHCLRRQRQAATRRAGSLRVSVRRENCMEDSFEQLRFKKPDELRGRLHVTFSGEEGIDAGGLTREWYSVLAKDVFNPGYCLFSPTSDGATYQPNAMSGINDNHLNYFKFVGRVVGKAVADGHLFDAHFTRSFYKHMLGLQVAVEDMEAADPEFYKNLKQILSHSLDDLGLDLTFSAESREFGREETRDLVPDGRHLAVTDENKAEYVALMCRHRMTSGIHAQIEAFLGGFHDLVPPELISIFNEKELELLISGLPDVDLDDLQLHTEYSGWRPTDQGIEWFWAALRSLTREERALFLQFVTGSAKVPVEGFAQLQGMRGVQKFNIHEMYGNNAQLPAAHTCFNQLDLPEYESEAQTREKLLFALRECSEGFGFG